MEFQIKKRGWIATNTVVFAGIVLVLLAGAAVISGTCLDVYGLRTHLGVIDGDTPQSFSFRVFNPHLSPVSFDVHAPSCTSDGLSDQQIMVQPLTSQIIDYPFDPSHLRIGPGNQTNILLAYVNGKPNLIKQTIFYTVKRLGHDSIEAQ